MKYTAKQIEHCQGTLSESLGRGLGAIEYKRQPGGVRAYFRYYRDSKPVRVKIGAVGKKSGLSLAEVRTKAGDLAKLRQEISPADLKVHLERQKPSGGTLKDLLKAYLSDMERRDAVSLGQASKYFERDVFKANPSLSKIKASEVVPADIVGLLAKVHNRGGIASANRLRTFLSAAYNFGLKADNDHTRPTDSPVFALNFNPVTATKFNAEATTPGTRVITTKEIKHLWHNFETAYSVGSIMAAFVKFLFATGGQRPLQVLRATWESYDFDKNTLTIIDPKGKGASKIHVIPLTDRALQILNQLPRIGEHPFTAYGHKSFTQSSVRQALKRYHTQNPDIEYYQIRDIRRTCKNLLVDAGVSREQRNLLQSHGLHGVDFKHYDRHDHLPEKVEALRKYDKLLETIINS